jgi:hypothetical protein
MGKGMLLSPRILQASQQLLASDHMMNNLYRRLTCSYNKQTHVVGILLI